MSAPVVAPSIAAISDKANRIHTEFCEIAKFMGGVATLDQLIDVLELVGSLAHALANQSSIPPSS